MACQKRVAAANSFTMCLIEFIIPHCSELQVRRPMYLDYVIEFVQAQPQFQMKSVATVGLNVRSLI